MTIRHRASTPAIGRQRCRDDRGASALEFALVFPVFMLVVIGLFTGANLVNRQIQVSHAARDGARYGASLDVRAGWADAVKAKVVKQAVGSFDSADVCVALVTGPGDSPSVVTAGTPLDPTARVVVRVAAKGSFSWLVGSSNSAWKATSTALWEPFEEYTGQGGIPSTAGLTNADFSAPSTADPSDATCRGAGGTNQCAYMPDSVGTTTTVPVTSPMTVPTTVACPPTQTEDLSSAAALSAFVRTGTGGQGTKLTATLPAKQSCTNPVTVTFTVGKTLSYNSRGAAPPPDNLTVASPSWFGSSSLVMTSNLEMSRCCWEVQYGYVEVTMAFSRPVSNLTFDIPHIQHDQSTGAWRYLKVWLSDASDDDLKPISPYNYTTFNLKGGNGTSGNPWNPNDAHSAFGYSQQIGSTHVMFTGAVTVVKFHFDIYNGYDNNPKGWPGPNVQSGIANLTFTHS